MAKRSNVVNYLDSILISVPPWTSEAKPGHFGVPKTTFRIPGQSIPNRDCPGKTGTVGQLARDPRPCVVIFFEFLLFFQAPRQ